MVLKDWSRSLFVQVWMVTNERHELVEKREKHGVESRLRLL